MGHPKIFSDTEKRSLEAYRISQFGSPLHSRLAHPSLAIDEHPSPGDTGRVVLHFDVDAFYAQVEEVRDPSLRDRPLGITQKYIIVTSNYPARKHGVTKLMAISEAKRLCPDIALVSGEDLTPYRLASRRIQEVLQRFGTVERLGMDECFVDVTDEVQRRLRAGEPRAGGFRGHVFAAGTALRQDNPYRPQDVRAAADRVPGEASCGGGSSAAEVPAGEAAPAPEPWALELMVGSAIAEEARAMVKLETGFRSSCGISANKMLSKLVSGLHKPDDQTTLLPSLAAGFMATLPVRAIPGVGHRTSLTLKDKLGIETVPQLLGASKKALEAELGPSAAAWLLAAARGHDPKPVAAKGAPKSITVEDSFKRCDDHGAVQQVLRTLAPDLVCRLGEDALETGRRAGTLTVRWRNRGPEYRRSSASCPMPVLVNSSRTPPEQKAELIVAAAAALLRQNLPAAFSLAVINIGACNLAAAGGDYSSRTIRDILGSGRPGEGAEAAGPPGDGPPSPRSAHPGSPAASGRARALADAATLRRRSYGSGASPRPALSKRQERELREGSLLGAAAALRRPDGAAACGSPGSGSAASPLRPAALSAGGSDGGGGGGSAPPHGTAAEACEEGAGDEAADRELALRLQREEVEAYRRLRRAASGAPAKRGGAKGSGPLDAFVKRLRR